MLYFFYLDESGSRNPSVGTLENPIGNFYTDHDNVVLHGLKVWPDNSPLVQLAQDAWENTKKNPSVQRDIDVGLG